MSNEEVASILRNWTVGEIGTISAAVGILAHYRAEPAELQKQLRAVPELLPSAIQEVHHIHGPLAAHRRVTTRPVAIGGRKINAGEHITLMWIAASRDERVFENMDSFRLDRDQGENLRWGAGVHACPGAPLARLEMRVFFEELMAGTSGIATVPEKAPTLVVDPASGFAELPLHLCPR